MTLALVGSAHVPSLAYARAKRIRDLPDGNGGMLALLLAFAVYFGELPGFGRDDAERFIRDVSDEIPPAELHARFSAGCSWADLRKATLAAHCRRRRANAATGHADPHAPVRTARRALRSLPRAARLGAAGHAVVVDDETPSFTAATREIAITLAEGVRRNPHLSNMPNGSLPVRAAGLLPADERAAVELGREMGRALAERTIITLRGDIHRKDVAAARNVLDIAAQAAAYEEAGLARKILIAWLEAATSGLTSRLDAEVALHDLPRSSGH